MSALNKVLKSGSTIASKLDWARASGTLLSLDIGAESIGLAVASHPSYGEAPLPLEPVRITLETRNNKRVLSPAVAQQLQEVVKAYNVSSFVVSWPVQKEGRCGAACGKVLHTLDSLIEDANVITSKRPLCLWDENHYQAPDATDEWGRNPLYGEPCKDLGKTVYRASEEQYRHQSSSAVAAQVMTDFIKNQWPEIHTWQSEQQAPSNKTLNTEVAVEWLDNYEDTGAYMNVSV